MCPWKPIFPTCGRLTRHLIQLHTGREMVENDYPIEKLLVSNRCWKQLADYLRAMDAKNKKDGLKDKEEHADQAQ
jgi:hypothetical protein